MPRCTLAEPCQPQTVFGRIALWVIRHGRLTATTVAIITLVQLILALGLTVNSNTIDLLPDDDPSTMALRELNRVEGGVTTLSITVGGGSEDGRHAYLEQVALGLEALPDRPVHFLDLGLLHGFGFGHELR